MLQIAIGIEPGRRRAVELLQERGRVAAAANVVAHGRRLPPVEDDEVAAAVFAHLREDVARVSSCHTLP